MTDGKISAAAAIDAAYEWVARKYEGQVELRAFVHLLPHIGPALDVVIAEHASQIHRERVQHFLEDLRSRLERVEGSQSLDLKSPAFVDVMRATFENVARSRSERKRALFARLITRQIADGFPWEESEMGVRLISRLEEIHIEILGLVLQPRPDTGKIVGDQFWITLEEAVLHAEDPPLYLPRQLPHHAIPALQMACAELISFGLLHDEGIGKWNGKPMLYFKRTDLAVWLKDHLLE